MGKSTILLCGPPRDAVGGGPTHIRNLLGSPLATKFRFVVFETGSRGAESPARDEPVGSKLWRLASGPFALAVLLVRHRPAIVHINSAVDAKGFWREVPQLIVCKLFGARVVYQVHGGSLAKLTAARGMRSIVRTVYAWPDAFVVLASVERTEFERLGGLRRLVVIPNAVETAVFAAGAPRVHSGAIRRLAYLGRLSGEKGERESIEALALLRDDAAFPGLELSFAGTGPARAELEALAASHGVAERVKFLGAIQGDEKVRFLKAADVLLLPSYAEGLPYVILESLAAGTPVVTTRVGGIPDVVKTPDHGRFVAPRDPAAIVAALRDLASSPEALRGMSRACSEWAERELGVKGLALRFEALYRDLGAVPLGRRQSELNG